MPFPRTCEGCKKEFEVKSRATKGRFCSKICMDEWQRSCKWEDRVGTEVAKKVREDMKQRMAINNLTLTEEALCKKSESMKKFLRDNPEARQGENNPFFGKKHTDEFCQNRSKERKGKRFYNDEQFNRQNKNTLRGDKHPLWKNGASMTKYIGFTRKFKKTIRNRDGNICVECGKVGKGGILSVHHIDYDKNNTTSQNSITLCPRCHGKTNHSDREIWISYFRQKYKIQLGKTI